MEHVAQLSVTWKEMERNSVDRIRRCRSSEQQGSITYIFKYTRAPYTSIQLRERAYRQKLNSRSHSSSLEDSGGKRRRLPEEAFNSVERCIRLDELEVEMLEQCGDEQL